MRDYEKLLQLKAPMPDLAVIQQDIDSADDWKDAYWIGSFVYDQASGEADKLIMNAYEKAFSLSLNIRTNRECFLVATQQIAKIYFQFRMYDEAINKLMLLESNFEDLPDWVHLYYAAAQIQTENILLWAENPDYLFKRIDGINEADPESVKRRKFLFLEFLNRISELSKTKDVSSVAYAPILQEAEKLGVSESGECMNFKVAFGLAERPAELPERETIPTTIPARAPSVYEQMAAELNRRVAELQKIIDNQKLVIERTRAQAEQYQKECSYLQAEKRSYQNRVDQTAQELKSEKEREYAFLQQIKALQIQLSGSEAARQGLEENASVIGELQVDVEGLKTTLSVTRKENEKLRFDAEQDKASIDKLTSDLQKAQDEIQDLHATITSQKTQIEVAEAAVKAAEEKAEHHAVETNAASSGMAEKQEQPTLIDILTVDNFLPRRQKILIIGGSETKENHLRGKLKSMGFDFSKDQLEFELEYENVKDYASRIKPWSGKYAGIIIGPCPHKAKDIDGYSSFIEQLKSEEGYPHVEEARDKSGSLKISNASIGEAMMRMAVYLQSVA